MAFTASPQFNTYKTVKISFDGTPLYRYGDLSVQRDLNIVNFYYDRISQENKERITRLKKRPGLTTTTYSLSKASSSDALRGTFYDVNTNSFYWAVNNKVYSVAPDSGISIRTVTTLATSSGQVGFTSFLKSDGTKYVVFSDGTDLWVDNYTTATEVTDADLPTPHQPDPLYLDGYIFLIKAGTNDIYNSVVDDPTSWESDEFIQAEISSDVGKRLYKVKNYIVCLGLNSVEYFWNAGNAEGSPLSRNDSPTRGVGYLSYGAQISDTVYFVGQDERSNIAVYSINSFKVERISNPVVDRTLQTVLSTPNANGQLSLNKDGVVVSVDGHTFYCITTSQTTWAYDIDTKVWYEWRTSGDTALQLQGSWAMLNGSCYVAVGGQTYISVMSPSVYQDFGENFTCRYTTEPNRFDTFNWKILHRVSLSCTNHLTTGTSNAQLYWTTRDWATVTGSKNINVFSPSPFATRFGRFRDISFRIEYTDNYPFMMDNLELDINVGGI